MTWDSYMTAHLAIFNSDEKKFKDIFNLTKQNINSSDVPKGSTPLLVRIHHSHLAIFLHFQTCNNANGHGKNQVKLVIISSVDAILWTKSRAQTVDLRFIHDSPMPPMGLDYGEHKQLTKWFDVNWPETKYLMCFSPYWSGKLRLLRLLNLLRRVATFPMGSMLFVWVVILRTHSLTLKKIVLAIVPPIFLELIKKKEKSFSHQTNMQLQKANAFPLHNPPLSFALGPSQDPNLHQKCTVSLLHFTSIFFG